MSEPGRMLPLLRGPPDALPASPALGRSAVYLPTAPANPEPGGIDESHRPRSTEACPALVAAAVLQVPRRGIARRGPLPDGHGGLARRAHRVRRLRRWPLQSLRIACASLQRAQPTLAVQALLAGRRLPGGLPDLGRVVLLPEQRKPSGMPVPLLGVQLPGRLREPVVLLLHRPADAVPAAAVLGRPSVHAVPAAAADPEPRCGWLDRLISARCSCSRASSAS